jgi:hypothetical protein
MDSQVLRVLSHVTNVAGSAPSADIVSFLIETWHYYANELAPAFTGVRTSVGLCRDRRDIHATISLSASVGALYSDLTLKLGTLTRDTELLDAAASDLGRGSDRSVWALVRTASRQSGDPGWVDELDVAAESFAAILRDGDSGNLRDLLRRTFALEYICCHAFALCLVLSAALKAERS